MKLRGTTIESGAQGEKGPRRTSPLAVSVVLHGLLIVLLAQVLIAPQELLKFLALKREPVPVERIGFLRLPVTPAGEQVEGRSGGDGRPVSESPPPRLIAPSAVPSELPPISASAPAPAEQGSGPLVGTGGPAQGVRPSYRDPRLWSPPGDLVTAPKTPTQRLDSVIATLVQPYNDSVAVARGQRQPGDWTFERNGQKYGIDPQFIRLGKVSIPTAILALLPINMQANPVVSERNRINDRIHSDIFSQAQRGMNEAEFRKAVRSIRERKERERLQASDDPDVKKGPAAAPAPVPPGERD